MPQPIEQIDIGFVDPAELTERARERGIFVFDLETTGLSPTTDHIEGVAFYIPEDPITRLGNLVRDPKPALRAWYPFTPDTFRTWVQPDETPEEQAARLKYERVLELPADSDTIIDAKAAWVELRQRPVVQNLRPAMPQDETMEALRPLFEQSPGTVCVAHNLKFDYGFMRHASGCEYGYWERSIVDRLAAIGRGDLDPGPKECGGLLFADSMLADFLSDENHYQYGLKRRTKELFGHEMTTYMDVMRHRKQSQLPFMADEPGADSLGHYAMEDCFWTWRLFEDRMKELDHQTPGERIDPAVDAVDQLADVVRKEAPISPFDRTRRMGNLERIFWGIDMKVCLLLEEMESTGVLIDWEWLREVTERLEVEKEAIIEKIESTIGWTLNPNSQAQVAALLFSPKERGGLGLSQKGVKRGKTGAISTGSKEISHLGAANPLVTDVLDWRSKDTIQANFSVKLSKLAQATPDQKIHSHFNQTGTKIHRLSSSNPVNLQNQPRDENLIRKAFCARLPDPSEDHFKALAKRERMLYEKLLTGAEIGALLDDPSLQLYSADYSQIELRMAAHLSGDVGMSEVYLTGKPCTRADDDAGAACERYKWWECGAKVTRDDGTQAKCKHTWIPAQWDPEKPGAPTRCPLCNGEKIEHQERCRHVDLHTRTAEDANVPRNPLAKCLDGSTLILALQRGRSGHELIQPVPIERLIGEIAPGAHRDITPTTIWTPGKPDAGYLEETAEAYTAIRRHDRPTKIVVTRRAIVVATEDHRFQVLGDHDSLDPSTPGYVHVPGRSLVEARNLEKGMKLPFADMANPQGLVDDKFHEQVVPQELRINPFTKEVDPDGPAAIQLNEDWAYFAGMFAGDGCASGNACTITHGSSEEYVEWRQVVREACDAVGLPNRVSKNKKHTVMGSRVVRRYFAGLELAKEAGTSGAKIMRVPSWVLTGGPRMMWQYLAGLFDTDGTVGGEKAGTVSVTAKSPEFVGQIAFMLRWLGMPVSIQPGWNKTYERWYYTLHVLAEGFQRFLKYCPMRYREKVEKLRLRDANVKRRCAPSHDEVLLVLDGGERTVYDFQIDTPDHLYLQGGLIGHNNLNFGVLYRIGAPRFCQYANLYDKNGDPMIEYAEQVIKAWYAAYPKINPFHVATERNLRANGWYACTVTGRRRRLDRERWKNEYRAITQGIQFQVSGSAQDILKRAMIDISIERERRIARARPAERRLWKKVKLILQVHDEVSYVGPVCLGPEIIEVVNTKMEGAARLSVPLIADCKSGRTWDDVH